MRSHIAKQILESTPEDVRIYTRLYADIVVRIHELLDAKDLTQKALAEKLGKQPSEISKWLKGDHNFTLRSLAKLQAELGEPLITVPRSMGFYHVAGKTITMKRVPLPKTVDNQEFQSATFTPATTASVA